MAKRSNFQGGIPGSYANMMKQAQRMQAQIQQSKEQLEQQKQDLKDKSQSSSPYDYEYIEGGDAQGYGDGTLW